MSAQTFAATIGGVTKAIEDARCAFVMNGYGDASFRVKSTGAAYVPSDGDAVVLTLGGASFWSGEVIDIAAEFLGPSGGTDVVVTCADNGHRLTRALSNTIYAPATTKATLQSLTNVGGAWNDCGITLHASQAVGPTLDTITAAWAKGDALAKLIADLSGYPYVVDQTGAIRLILPGSISSGVTLSTANANVESVTWQKDRHDYRNRVWVIFGPSEVRTVAESWNGDGVTRTFACSYHVSAAPGTVTINNGVTTVTKPVGVYGVDTMEWTFDAATGSYGSLRHDGAYTVLGVSDLLACEHASQFPNYTFCDDAAEVAARGQWNDAITLPDVTDLDEARATGLAFIRRSIPRPKVCRLTTRTDGITVGSTVVVSLSEIGISETMLVQRVDVQFVKSGANADPKYTLTLVSGSELVDTSAALFQRMIGGAPGASVASGSSASAGSVTTVVATVIEGDLGGSRQVGVTHSTWAPTREYRDWKCAETGPYTAALEVWTSNAATSVTPRVYDVTASSAVATGSASTSTTPAKQTLAFTGTDGHEYRLELLPSNTSNDVYGLGKVRT